MPRFLSPHFTLDELVLSQTAARRGIDNTPSPEILRHLRRLADVLEQVRHVLDDGPVLVSSGYRCAALNRAVGGARNSAHLDGLAADLTAPTFGTVMQVARAIASSAIEYDQVIHEYGTWVHLGLARRDREPRRQQLSVFRGTGYLTGIIGHQARLAARGCRRAGRRSRRWSPV